jgi:hypothetical protein
MNEIPSPVARAAYPRRTNSCESRAMKRAGAAEDTKAAASTALGLVRETFIL